MRLFIGVELDDHVRRAAAGVAEQLRSRFERSRTEATARWVEPENLHVTLWFIGEAKDDRAVEIQRVLNRAFAAVPFDLHVKGGGAFPPSGAPRVLWLGITEGTVPTVQIYEELKDRLASIGLEAEKRPYSPHVTIARVKHVGRASVRSVRETLSALTADCGSCRVSAVTLFRSHLSPKGSRYEPLLRVPLA